MKSLVPNLSRSLASSLFAGVLLLGAPLASAQDATPAASPSAANRTPVTDLGCWADAPTVDPTVGYPQWSAAPEMRIDTTKTYYATIHTNRGDIVVQLYADVAPKAVNNFICLATEHFYDGVTFHRIMRDFMIQTGDPTGTGRGGPGYSFEDELPGEDMNYTTGTLAMANAGPNTNGSQFFIVHKNASALGKTYTIFGKVVEGMDVVNTIAEIPVSTTATGEQSAPAVTMTVLGIDIFLEN